MPCRSSHGAKRGYFLEDKTKKNEMSDFYLVSCYFTMSEDLVDQTIYFRWPYNILVYASHTLTVFSVLC